jgi:general control protein GCN4
MDTSFDFGLGHLDGPGEFPWDSASNFTAINAGGAPSSTQTVSPKDIFNNNDGLGSAPPSTAFTNLTSPDINESPYGVDSAYETSPMFDNLDVTADPAWFSLFPGTAATNTQAAPEMQRNVSNVSNVSGVDRSSSSGSSPAVISLDSSHRRKSSVQSPLSATAGVNRRRRKGPLPPINVDANDKVAVKRARNTLAARESRQRKLDHVSQLEARIADLESTNGLLKETLVQHGYHGPLVFPKRFSDWRDEGSILLFAQHSA